MKKRSWLLVWVFVVVGGAAGLIILLTGHDQSSNSRPQESLKQDPPGDATTGGNTALPDRGTGDSQTAAEGSPVVEIADAATFRASLVGLSNEKKSRLIKDWLKALSRIDPREAMREARALIQEYPMPPGMLFEENLLTNLLINMDSSLAIELSREVEDPKLQGILLGNILNHMARPQNGLKSSFPEALRIAGAAQDPVVRSQAVLGLIAFQPFEGHEREMFEALVAHVPIGSGLEQNLTRLLASWAGTSPQEAAAAALELAPVTGRNAALAAVAKSWMQAGDARPVLAWVNSFDDPALRSGTLKSLLFDWASADLPGARTYVESLPVHEQESAANDLVLATRPETAEETLLWATRLQVSGSQNSPSRQSAYSWAASDPTGASHKIETLIPSLPPREAQSVMDGLIDALIRTDTESALGWAESRPSGPVRDAALSSAALNLSSKDPELVQTYPSLINNAETRERAVDVIFFNWSRIHREKARDWLMSQPIPQDRKSLLLRSLQ